jgi:hypothetical protein
MHEVMVAYGNISLRDTDKKKDCKLLYNNFILILDIFQSQSEQA